MWLDSLEPCVGHYLCWFAMAKLQGQIVLMKALLSHSCPVIYMPVLACSYGLASELGHGLPFGMLLR